MNHLLPEYKEIESKYLETLIAMGIALIPKHTVSGWVLRKGLRVIEFT